MAPFSISLAQWSLHRTIRAGELDPLDFPAHTKNSFGIDAVEYVSGFFPEDRRKFTEDLLQRAKDVGVQSLLVMVDGAGDLGAPDAGVREKAVENHLGWAETALALGCHSIRVNAHSSGTRQEQCRLVAEGLRSLVEKVEATGLCVLVENHGGLSSDASWLLEVIERVDHPSLGTLPDFGNFFLNPEMTEWYDRYEGVTQMMTYARAVSAKSNEFDAEGQEVHTDYDRMMSIVLNAGYHGYVGIEYEGTTHTEGEGIRLTKALLERVAASQSVAKESNNG